MIVKQMGASNEMPLCFGIITETSMSVFDTKQNRIRSNATLKKAFVEHNNIFYWSQ